MHPLAFNDDDLVTSIHSKQTTHPYHKALAIVIIVIGVCVAQSYSQATGHRKGMLLDTSVSMTRGEANRNLFRDCVTSAKRLLAEEEPNTRVWVSTIASDSFGRARMILTGWTPEMHGIFTDDLGRVSASARTTL